MIRIDFWQLPMQCYIREPPPRVYGSLFSIPYIIRPSELIIRDLLLLLLLLLLSCFFSFEILLDVGNGVSFFFCLLTTFPLRWSSGREKTREKNERRRRRKGVKKKVHISSTHWTGFASLSRRPFASSRAALSQFQ